MHSIDGGDWDCKSSQSRYWCIVHSWHLHFHRALNSKCQTFAGIKTVVIFPNKGRLVPILEHSTGTQVLKLEQNRLDVKLMLGLELLIERHQLWSFCRRVDLIKLYYDGPSKLQRHLQKVGLSVLQLSLTIFTWRHAGLLQNKSAVGSESNVVTMTPQLRAEAAGRGDGAMQMTRCWASPASSPLLRLIRVNPLLVQKLKSSQVASTNPRTAPWNAPSLPTRWCQL